MSKHAGCFGALRVWPLLLFLAAVFHTPGVRAATANRVDFSGNGVLAAGGEKIPGSRGMGWSSRATEDSPTGYPGPAHFVELDKTLVVPEAGGMHFVLQRSDNGKIGPINDFEAVVSFLDNTGGSFVTFFVVWEDIAADGTHLQVMCSDNPKRDGLWDFDIPVGRTVQNGESLDVRFEWGKTPQSNKLYVDGREVRFSYNRDDLYTKGGPPRTFADHVAGRLSRVVVGTEFFHDPNRTHLRNWSPLNDSILWDLEFLSGSGSSVLSLTDDTFKVPGISGKLVAGDHVNVELRASPGGAASFDMGNVKGIALAEAPPTEGGPGIPAVGNGTYRGAYTIRTGDDYENGRIVGHFTSQDNVAADPVISASKWTIETKPVVTFAINRKDLPADSASKARIKLVAKDANGNPVKGRHLKLTLGTTDEYTGTVGAGDFGKDVGATVETRWRGETDSWGEVEFDYTAGFAAKTVILSAKDLDSGGVSVDYLTAYKEASIDIALTPPVNRAAARRGLMYVLKVEASRTELTADGRSRSVIRATLLDPGGKAVAGDPVAFALSSPNGTVRTIAGTTDGSGTATAEYTAGKKIGIVVVTATATLRNASDSVSITLLSDAPAKIYLKARPESLPADGFSRADLSVKVTDINDNPNADTKVEFRVAKGGGKLDSPDRVTDRFGDAADRYTSGTTPGVATILATVRSKVPSESELAKGKNVLFAPYSSDSDEIRVEKWLKRRGEGFVKGDPLVEYTVGRGRTAYTLTAPYDGTMGQQFVEYWDRAEMGQTLAVLHPAAGGR